MSYTRKQISPPQDHSSWVFIFSPLLIGLSAGRHVSPAPLYLVVASVTAFLFRQPITMVIKAHSGRRPKTDLPAARFWIIVYGLILLLALTGLILSGAGYILLLAIPGIPAFAFTAFNLLVVLGLGLLAVLPRYLFLPYLVQWCETMWGIFHPAVKWKPARIGIRQLIVSMLWTVLFILTWRLE